MPSANFIRKEILQALENHILPALWHQAPLLGYVDASLQFPPGINSRLISKTVPRAERKNVEIPLQVRWPRHNLHSSFYPYFGFLYEGMADERTLVTPAQAAEFKLAKGVYAIRWQAPSALLFPSGVARSGGDPILWEDKRPGPAMKILFISISSELLLHTHTEDGAGRCSISHALQINDPGARSLCDVFIDELHTARSREQHCAQAVLLALMLRLQKKLRSSPGRVVNSARSPVPLKEAVAPDDHAGVTCRLAAVFVQMHLCEPLTLPGIAKQVGLSPAHLNRLFQRFHGTSVMHYVRNQRIASAKRMLEEQPENVAEVAQLVGFKRANLFCNVFHQETGMTPGQYRRWSRRKNNDFMEEDSNQE